MQRPSRQSSAPLLLTALLIACGGPKNATVGTWAGTSAEQIPGARSEHYRLAIGDKNATLYDGTGSAVGTFPVSFPSSNEAVLTGLLGMAVDVTAQPDGSVRVVGLHLSSTPPARCSVARTSLP